MPSTKVLSELERGARHRLAVIGVPTYMINPMVDLVWRWIQSCGPEWTVKRLKNLKIDLIRDYSNLPYISQWVRKNSKGEFYGVVGSMFRYCKSAGNPRKAEKRFSKILQALNIYTLLTSESVTETQMKKFMQGVNCEEPTHLEWDSFYCSYLHDVALTVGHRLVQRGGNSLIEYRGSPNKRSPVVPSGGSSVQQDSDILREIEWYSIPANRIFAWEYHELYAPVTSCVSGPLVPVPNTQTDEECLYGGEVHFLQEPGMKLRAIASPFRIHQLALKPLGDAIYSILSGLPWDCTFDQSKALPWIQASLKEGKEVFSIDLTGATDYFPMEVQILTLSEIFGDIKDISLFNQISRFRWKSEVGDIEWKRGQPLGLYPSFGAFALTHGLILNYLSGGFKNQFYVLGDDVVILDRDLYDKYIQFLDSTHCPWSSEKSITSNSVAEFSGKVITQCLVTPQYKWRKMSNDNFLDICRNLGPRSRELLSPRQKRVFDAVKHLLPPLGLGYSYKGSNLYKMITETEKVLARIEEAGVRSLVDLSILMSRNCYSSSIPYQLNLEEVDKIRETFDVKVSTVYQQLVISRLENLYRAFSDIPRALDLMPRLPTDMVPLSRVTTLVRYEGLLQLTKG